ncbi:MAG: hypothetical protein HQK79_07030 [Desulfobacterales bacterium]|nr:hypothetical protein [Desulfobacterales bacterium]
MKKNRNIFILLSFFYISFLSLFSLTYELIDSEDELSWDINLNGSYNIYDEKWLTISSPEHIVRMNSFSFIWNPPELI